MRYPVKRLLFLATLVLCISLSAGEVNRHVCADRTPKGACAEASGQANLTNPILRELSSPAGPTSEAAAGKSIPNFQIVPEPLSLILIGSGLLAIAGFRKFRGR